VDPSRQSKPKWVEQPTAKATSPRSGSAKPQTEEQIECGRKLRYFKILPHKRRRQNEIALDFYELRLRLNQCVVLMHSESDFHKHADAGRYLLTHTKSLLAHLATLTRVPGRLEHTLATLVDNCVIRWNSAEHGPQNNAPDPDEHHPDSYILQHQFMSFESELGDLATFRNRYRPSISNAFSARCPARYLWYCLGGDVMEYLGAAWPLPYTELRDVEWNRYFAKYRDFSRTIGLSTFHEFKTLLIPDDVDAIPDYVIPSALLNLWKTYPRWRQLEVGLTRMHRHISGTRALALVEAAKPQPASALSDSAPPVSQIENSYFNPELNPASGTVSSKGREGKPAEPKEEYIFRRNGVDWEIKIGTGRLNAFVKLDGLFYLHYLVVHAGRRFTGTELRAAKTLYDQAAVNRSAASAEDGQLHVATHAGDVADGPALQAYKAKYERNKEELADARANNNDSEIERLQTEMGDLLRQIKGATGLGGKRTRVSSASKNNRDAVKKAIYTALDHIQKKDEAAFDHFGSSFSHKNFLSYKPVQPIIWIL
jgi:hypothetical protein